jgi:hypothetical protein
VKAPDVRAKIVTRLRDGELPRAPPNRLYGGVGSDTTCACCDRRISRGELEFEVEFAAVAAFTPEKVVMHPECLRLWYDACSS